MASSTFRDVTRGIGHPRDAPMRARIQAPAGSMALAHRHGAIEA